MSERNNKIRSRTADDDRPSQVQRGSAIWKWRYLEVCVLKKDEDKDKDVGVNYRMNAIERRSMSYRGQMLTIESELDKSIIGSHSFQFPLAGSRARTRIQGE